MCKCALLNCSSCPVCVPRRDPNLPLTKEVLDACLCSICSCHCLCAGWLATPASRAEAKRKAEEMAATYLHDNPNPTQDAVSMLRESVEYRMTPSQAEAVRALPPAMAAAALREGAATMRVGVAGSVVPGAPRNHRVPAAVAQRIDAANGMASDPGSSTAGEPMGPPPPRAPNSAAATSSSQQESHQDFTPSSITNFIDCVFENHDVDFMAKELVHTICYTLRTRCSGCYIYNFFISQGNKSDKVMAIELKYLLSCLSSHPTPVLTEPPAIPKTNRSLCMPRVTAVANSDKVPRLLSIV